jgi:hypothetical protein
VDGIVQEIQDEVLEVEVDISWLMVHLSAKRISVMTVFRPSQRQLEARFILFAQQ